MLFSCYLNVILMLFYDASGQTADRPSKRVALRPVAAPHRQLRLRDSSITASRVSYAPRITVASDLS